MKNISLGLKYPVDLNKLNNDKYYSLLESHSCTMIFTNDIKDIEVHV